MNMMNDRSEGERMIIIKPSVPTVPKDWSDRLYEKQMKAIADMGSKWLLHPDNHVRKEVHDE